LETAVARKGSSPTILRNEVFQGKSCSEVGRSREKDEYYKIERIRTVKGKARDSISEG
jgi:hypothetical protein